MSRRIHPLATIGIAAIALLVCAGLDWLGDGRLSLGRYGAAFVIATFAAIVLFALLRRRSAERH